MKYLFLSLLFLFALRSHGQLFYGYDIQDYLVSAVHPNGCIDNYVTGLPDDSTWVNFNPGDVMTGLFGMAWTDGTGNDLLLETSYHRDNYNVRLYLSTGVYSSIVQVFVPDWTQIPDTSWVHLFTNCIVGAQISSRWLLPLDFAQFGIGSGDLVTGIEITFLATGGAPDLAGVYIIAEPCNIFSLGPDRLLCEGNSFTLNATTPNATYEWQDNSTNPTFLVTEPGTYWVNVTIDDCTTTDTVHVYDQIIPLNIGNDTTLCPGETLLLNATTPGATYEWQNNSSSATFNVTDPGTYWVIVTVDGCDFSDTIEVDYADIPPIDFGDDAELCQGETLLLNATTPGATYLWQDNSTNPTYLVSTPSTYWVNATVGECIVGDTIIVDYVDPPPLNLGADITLCHGETLLIGNIFQGASYQWQDNSDDATYLVTEPGTYWVIVEQNDCTISDTIEVEYYDEIPVDLGDDLTLCNGETLLLDVFLTGASYDWHDNSNLPVYNVDGPGIYWVILEINDCYAGDTIEIDYTQAVNFDLGNDTTLCQGETLLLEVNIPGATYLWQNNSTSSSFLVTQPGEYWVEVDVDDCIAIDTIVVEYLALSAIDLGNDTTLCEGESLLLNAFIPGATYSWQDNSSASSFLVTQPGNYSVTVNLESCSAEDVINVSYNAIPVIALGNDTTLCQGASILLQVSSAGASFQWQDNSTGSTFLVTQAGTYWVDANLGECTSTDSIHVNYISISSVDLGNDTTLCEGNTVVLNAFNPGASYMWNDNSTASSILVDQTGTYWVNVSIGNCSAADTINVAYLVLNAIDLGDDTTLCQQEVLLLDATTPGGSIIWQDNSTNSNFNVIQPGVYWVVVNLGACSASDTIQIDYINIPPVDIGNDTTLCDAPSVLLNATTPGAAYLWQDNSTNSTLNVTQTGIYSVTVSIDHCDVRDTIAITFLEPASIELGNDTTLCDGQTFLLDANAPGANFLWQDNSTGQTFLVTQPGTYWVEINLQDCSVADTIDIFYHPALSVDLGNDTTLCPGESIALDATTLNATYQWQDNSGAPVFTASQPGVYWVSIDIDGCKANDSIDVSYLSITPVNLGNDTSLCEGETLLLNAATSNGSYAWHDNSSGATFLVDQEGAFWVTVNVQGCSTKDTIQVDYVVLPAIELGNDTTLCAGEKLTLTADVPGATYQWQDNSTTSMQTVSQQGIFWVSASIGRCSTGDTIAVEYIDVGPLTLGNDTTLCDGEMMILNPAVPGATYLWQDGSGNQNFVVTDAGLYWVEVYLDNCKATDSLLIEYKSTIQFDLGRDTTLCEGQFLILDPGIAEPTNYIWQDNSDNETFVVQESGEYTLEVDNECGSSSDSISILMEDCRCYLFVPNVFTPNADHINDQLVPSANCELSDFLFMVFDRAGDQFFVTNEYGKGWDGTYKNQKAQVGVYAYVIIYSFKDGRKDAQHGDITLIR